MCFGICNTDLLFSLSCGSIIHLSSIIFSKEGNITQEHPFISFLRFFTAPVVLTQRLARRQWKELVRNVPCSSSRLQLEWVPVEQAVPFDVLFWHVLSKYESQFRDPRHDPCVVGRVEAVKNAGTWPCGDVLNDERPSLTYYRGWRSHCANWALEQTIDLARRDVLHFYDWAPSVYCVHSTV